ncbi:unnamed protein product [marine sediment metagenome]|uniref:Uncharacterized protein n=1 Tax=marine sediment metagenome TaxID=412755 RepID=X0TTR3_9ZZZZ
MTQFPLFESIVKELDETKKNKFLTDNEKNDCCLEIKTFDKNSFEILYVLIKTYEVKSTPSNTCILPYDSKELKTGIKFDFHNLPATLQQIIYEFCNKRKKNLVEKNDNKF